MKNHKIYSIIALCTALQRFKVYVGVGEETLQRFKVCVGVGEGMLQRFKVYVGVGEGTLLPALHDL